MSRIYSDKLHRLIRSLSPSEKRYFQVYISRREEQDNKYRLLFEALSRAAQYRPERIIKKVYGTDTADVHRYTVLKGYLYDLILRVLQDFDEKNNVESRLNRLLQSVAVLYRRSLYDDCQELLHRAGKVARQYEQFGHWIEIIAWKKQLAYITMDVDFLHHHLAALDQEEATVLACLSNLVDYRRAFFGMYTTIKREASSRSEERTNRLQAVLAGADFDNPDSAQSHRARVLYYRTLNLHAYASQDINAFYSTGRFLLQLIENQPHFLKENITDYIAALSNYILACGLRQHYKEVDECLYKLKNLTPITEDDRRKIHHLYFTNRLAMCHFTGAFEAALQDVEQCESEAHVLYADETHMIHFGLQYAYIYFGCANYDEALNQLNRWMNQPRTVAREDLQSLARILNLILHYELGNTVLLEYLMRSAKRFLQRKNRFLELERRFLALMRDLLKAHDQTEKIKYFEQIEAEWAQLPGSKVISQTFDMESWFESKIKKRPFAAIVQRKWANRRTQKKSQPTDNQ
jgi:hypothetical protein